MGSDRIDTTRKCREKEIDNIVFAILLQRGPRRNVINQVSKIIWGGRIECAAPLISYRVRWEGLVIKGNIIHGGNGYGMPHSFGMEVKYHGKTVYRDSNLGVDSASTYIPGEWEDLLFSLYSCPEYNQRMNDEEKYSALVKMTEKDAEENARQDSSLPDWLKIRFVREEQYKHEGTPGFYMDAANHRRCWHPPRI